MAQSGRTNRIYFPNLMHFQLAANEENPDGRVITMQQGWNEVPEELQNHPMIKSMQPETEGESEYRRKLIEAEKEKADAISEAEAKFRDAVNESERARAEDINRRSEERAKQLEDAQREGVVAHVAHPDPDAEHAIALTLPPAMQVVPTAGMTYRSNDDQAQGPTAGPKDARHQTTAPAAQAVPGTDNNEPQRGTNPVPPPPNRVEGTPGHTPTGRTRG